MRENHQPNETKDISIAVFEKYEDIIFVEK